MIHFDTVAQMVVALQGLDYGERFTLGTVLHEVVRNSPGFPEKKCIRPFDEEYEKRCAARVAEKAAPSPSSAGTDEALVRRALAQFRRRVVDVLRFDRYKASADIVSKMPLWFDPEAPSDE